MTDRDHRLSLTRQAELLGISRGSLYYEPRPVSEDDLRLMRRIDELHMEFPFAGSRMMKGLLQQEGFTAGRLHVGTLMKQMGIEALYRKPNTSKPAPGHKIYPYLLRKLAVTRPNQVWAMDITYIPMARGFVYLTAVLDWFSRKVLAWRLSVTLETEPCLEALKEAMARYGKPKIMNADQGSQFTSIDFIKALRTAEIQISMDGQGAWRDNVFVERLWRTIKYEEVYLHAYDSVSDARSGLARYLAFYNSRRPHSSLDGQTPDQAYLNPSRLIPVAA
jgi:putative transposase